MLSLKRKRELGLPVGVEDLATTSWTHILEYRRWSPKEVWALSLTCRSFNAAIASSEGLPRRVLASAKCEEKWSVFNWFLQSSLFKVYSTTEARHWMGAEDFDADATNLLPHWVYPRPLILNLSFKSVTCQTYNRLHPYNWNLSKDIRQLTAYPFLISALIAYPQMVAVGLGAVPLAEIFAHEYVGNFVDVHAPDIFHRLVRRSLNGCEKKLFNVARANRRGQWSLYDKEGTPIATVFGHSQCVSNLNDAFGFALWRDCVPWHRYFMAGGGVMHCVSTYMFGRWSAGVHHRSGDVQDIDVFSVMAMSDSNIRVDVLQIAERICRRAERVRVIVVFGWGWERHKRSNWQLRRDETSSSRPYRGVKVTDVYLNVDVAAQPSTIAFADGCTRSAESCERRAFCECRHYAAHNIICCNGCTPILDALKAEKHQWIKIQFVHCNFQRGAENQLFGFDIDASMVMFRHGRFIAHRSWLEVRTHFLTCLYLSKKVTPRTVEY